MIDHWAERLHDRQTITEFWDWLISTADGTESLFDVYIETALNTFHGIDVPRLEAERRAVIERHREIGGAK